MKNPIPPVSSRDIQDSTLLPWAKREVIPVLRAIKTRADAAPVFVIDKTDSDGAGTYLTLWSDVIPTGRRWTVVACVGGSADTVDAAYQIAGTFKNLAGTVSQIGTTTAVVSHESAAGCDAKFDVTGTTISVQVRDDAAAAMTWDGFVEVRASLE